MTDSKAPSTLNEIISERIGKDLVSLIPADEWDEMVSNQINKFKSETFPKIVQDLLTEKAKLDIKTKIDEYTSTGEWDASIGQYINKGVVEITKSNASDIMHSLLYPIINGAMQDFRSRM